MVQVDDSAVRMDAGSLSIDGPVGVVVRNVGSVGSVPCEVLAFRDLVANGTFDPGLDDELGRGELPEVGVGARVLVEIGVAGRSRFLKDPIHALVDADGRNAEADEANNIGHSGLACSQAIEPAPLSVRLAWSWQSSAVSGLNVMNVPAVMDLDGDGVPELIFGSTPSEGGGSVEVGNLRALRGDTGAEVFTVTDTSLRVNTASSVAAGDIDADGLPEIIACDAAGPRLIAFEHDGAFKWRSGTLEAINWGAPAIADLDGDGSPEIVVGREALDAQGTLLWRGDGGRGGVLSLVADIDLDGAPEVVAGNTAYRGDGTTLWRNLAVGDGYDAIGNFDEDVFPEIVVVAGGRATLLEHTGEVKPGWGIAIPGGGGGPPTVADYDCDGEPEVGVAGTSRYVVMETSGVQKWAQPTQDASSSVTGSSVFDFEGDGCAEVVYGDELYFRVYRGSTGEVLYQLRLGSCTWHEYPLVADVDADGAAEIVVAGNTNCRLGVGRGIRVFESAGATWARTRAVWNQYTYHITNIGDDGSIPPVEANSWLVHNSYRQNLLTRAPPAGLPDLTASFLRLRRAGGGTELVARVGNGGSAAAEAGVAVAFHEGDPGVGGTPLGEASTARSLEPGDYEDVAIRLPGELAEGVAVAHVAVDPADVVRDCRPENDLCSTAAPPWETYFIRGDANADGAVDVSDAAFALRYLFRAGPVPGCRDAVDLDDDESLNLNDPVYLLNFLFVVRETLVPPPSGICGPDPTPGEVECARFGPCE